MSPEQYKSHLATLGLTQSQAAAWLGVSVRTQRRYEKNGPEGPAARAVKERLARFIDTRRRKYRRSISSGMIVSAPSLPNQTPNDTFHHDKGGLSASQGD